MANLLDTDIDVLKKEEDYWVIYKPCGLSFHSENGVAGFVQTVKDRFPEQHFYPVHRLDKMTSGLILLATNKLAAQTFSTLFAEHKIEKYYLALSMKKPKKKQGTIKGGMAPARRGSWKLTQTKDNWAHTQFFSAPFSTSLSVPVATGIRVFLMKPLTGKTHQLRVALKSLGAPIMGDQRYGAEPSDRGYLHAFQLSFDWHGESKCYQNLPREGEHFKGIQDVLSDREWMQPEQLAWPTH